MEREQLEHHFTQMSDGSGEEAFASAREIINLGEDIELQKQATDVANAFIDAVGDDPSKFDEAMGKFIDTMKNQMSMVSVQMFRFGIQHASNIQRRMLQTLAEDSEKMVKKVKSEETKLESE